MTAYAFWLFWSFLVLAGRREVGVGVEARAKPDRAVAVGALPPVRSGRPVQGQGDRERGLC
jgi:hypothetical protein